jgi:uncharacterized membrane protein YbaN (DUF454 family)
VIIVINKGGHQYNSMRIFFIVLGITSVILAGFGIFLPGLPATPFLLLASFAFARSSKKMHNWLINHRIFGPILSDFLDKKGIRFPVKVFSIGIMWVMMLFSVFYLIDNEIVKYVAFAGAIVGTIAVLSFKTIRN